MNESRIRSKDQVRGFVSGAIDAQFRLAAGGPRERKRARNGLISEAAQSFRYRQLRRRDKGLILRYAAVSHWLQRRPGRTPRVLTCTGL